MSVFRINMDMETTLPTDLIKIGKAAKLLGVCTKTLRRWEEQGILLPTFKSASKHGTRYYSTQVLARLTKNYGLQIHRQSIQCLKTPDQAAIAAAKKQDRKKSVQLLPTLSTVSPSPSWPMPTVSDPRRVPLLQSRKTKDFNRLVSTDWPNWG
jgi:DNA-binding transcriptional MerR regulator